jgi:hypothetical protein
MSHGPSHEPLLRAALLGELRQDDPRMADLAACAECRAELGGLRAVTAALDAGARVDEVPVLGDPRGEADALAALTRISAAEPYGRRARRRARRLAPWIYGAAAASVIALAILRLLDTRDPDQQPLYIGDEAVPVLVAPLGEVERFDVFRWRYDAGHPYGFHLRIYASDGPADAPPLIQVEDWTQTTWTPTDAQRALLPPRIEWEVDVLDAHGEVSLTSSSSRAWRRSG